MEVRRQWTFITRHAQVLLAIARDPDMRVREVADAVEITERYAYRVLSDLQNAGFVSRSRRGRRNRYRVNPDMTLDDPIVEGHTLRELLRLSGRGDRDAVRLDRPLEGPEPARAARSKHERVLMNEAS